MARRPRWDTDDRGTGVADARSWEPLLESLADVAGDSGWIAEEPELHLLPHLASAAAGGPIVVRRTSTAADGTFVVELDWVADEEPSRRALRAALFPLIGAVAEMETVVHEPPASHGWVVEILTGSTGAEGPFAGHGHTIRLVVTDPSGPVRE